MASEWIPFASAAVGAAVGGRLSLVSSWFATRYSAASAIRLAAEERNDLGDQNRRTAVSAVLSEIRAALRVVDDPATLSTNTLVTYSMAFWKLNAGVVATIDPEIESLLHGAYSSMALANSVATQNLQLSYGAGFLNDRYRKHVREMVDAFKEAAPALEKWLDAITDHPHLS